MGRNARIAAKNRIGGLFGIKGVLVTNPAGAANSIQSEIYSNFNQSNTTKTATRSWKRITLDTKLTLNQY